MYQYAQTPMIIRMNTRPCCETFSAKETPCGLYTSERCIAPNRDVKYCAGHADRREEIHAHGC